MRLGRTEGLVLFVLLVVVLIGGLAFFPQIGFLLFWCVLAPLAGFALVVLLIALLVEPTRTPPSSPPPASPPTG